MGTQTVTEAFRKMGESILLEFAKGGLHSLIGGASANSAWSSIFGVSGKGGGIAGMAGNALTGGGAGWVARVRPMQAAGYSRGCSGRPSRAR